MSGRSICTLLQLYVLTFASDKLLVGRSGATLLHIHKIQPSRWSTQPPMGGMERRTHGQLHQILSHAHRSSSLRTLCEPVQTVQLIGICTEKSPGKRSMLLSCFLTYAQREQAKQQHLFSADHARGSRVHTVHQSLAVSLSPAFLRFQV